MWHGRRSLRELGLAAALHNVMPQTATAMDISHSDWPPPGLAIKECIQIPAPPWAKIRAFLPETWVSGLNQQS
jgi:hypothetical protein